MENDQTTSGRNRPHDGHNHQHGGGPTDTAGSQKVTDPVCGMTVDPQTAEFRAEEAGKTYFFCSAKCREKFVAEPTRFLKGEANAPAADHPPTATIYTCPMHPQIRQIGPGNCPICGMTLEPVVATADTGPSAELTDMTRRFWIGLVLAVPVLLLEMGGHLTNLHMLLGAQTRELDPARAGDARGVVGRRAVLCARVAFARHAPSQHVHADRHGDRRRLGL